MKQLMVLITLAGVILTSLGSAAALPGTQVTHSAEWTILIYMAADNDLESFALADLNEMEYVGSSDAVNVVVQIDRAAQYDTSAGNWTDTRRFLITQDRQITNLASEPVQIIGETNTGDPTTLANFLTWGIITYPARHYALVIWDHGGSWQGVAWDVASDNDDLQLSELRAALEQATTQTGLDQLDLIGFDACLMGAFEVYQSIAPYAKYGVASAELVPGDGWDYLGLLQALNANPTMAGDELGRVIVDAFMAYYTDIVSDYSVYNLAVVDYKALTGLSLLRVPQ